MAQAAVTATTMLELGELAMTCGSLHIALPMVIYMTCDLLTSAVYACMQEYGTGRYNKKHSTFFATMMRELGLNEENEFYFDLVPWQSLASMNHNFLLTERRRHYLRYAGGLTFFEVPTALLAPFYLHASTMAIHSGACAIWCCGQYYTTLPYAIVIAACVP